MNDKIDVVIPWVDGSDPIWKDEKNKWYKKLNPDNKSNSITRYESWDNLQYWFRAIEQYMPWINNIFFITWGHVPDFLNLENPKLYIVNHKDYIPKQYLPTFNINTIELNLHRIESLSENFIYFNDDIFPLVPINKEYYFKDNMICDEAIETPIIPILNGDIAQYTWNMKALDIAIINRNFSKRYIQNKYYDKWFFEGYGNLLQRNKSLTYWDNFVGFRDPHVPIVLKKSVFKEIWEKEYDVLNRACITKFRNYECVNQWLIRYWQLCEGKFYPRKTEGKSYTVTIDNCENIANIITNQKEQMICLNEDCTESEFELIKEKINNALYTLFPQKCMYEK